MFQHLFSRQRFKSLNLKDLIYLHISGQGNGFEIDDIISSDRFPKYIVDKINQIELSYRTEFYKIGTLNPNAFQSLKEIAENYIE